ncbi:MAG: PaaI family thioesterase [Planctomycetes bacterium]|nr:PaaI family thioesterase [Planctomycetota bacterium]
MSGDASSETPRFEPRDPGYEARVRASFEKQQFMTTLGASLAVLRPGFVRIDLPYDVRLTQQHGFLHAGAIASVLDSAAGYAALSLAAPGTGVLSVDFQVHLLSPARGRQFHAIARAIRSGRNLTICRAECRADDPEAGKLVSMLTATMMHIEDRAGITD